MKVGPNQGRRWVTLEELKGLKVLLVFPGREVLIALKKVLTALGIEVLDPLQDYDDGGEIVTIYIEPPLTEREMEVLQTVADTAALKIAASRLGITEGTVNRHLKNIRSKLGVDSTVQAVAEGIRKGLIR